ncbi:MAG: DUF3857 and transglutaminase domain-containing protein [Calditrichia bacterium]
MLPYSSLLLTLIFCFQAMATELVADRIRAAGDAADHPGAPFLTIFDSTKVEVQESGLSYVTMHRLFKVLTPAGALKLRVIKMDYDPLSAYVEIRAVRVHHADGSVTELDTAAVQDYPAPARAIYWGAREKMLEVGRLNPGEALEVSLFRKGFTYALLANQQPDEERYVPPMRGHFYDIVPFWSEVPLLEKVYRVTIPKEKQLQFEFYNGEVCTSVHFRGEKTIYTFVKENIEPFKKEPDMVALSDEAPKLLLSTSPDWYAKARWFYNVNEEYGSFEWTPEIKKKVDEILQGAKTEMDSVSRLTHWVADNIRYSGISMGPGEGYTLHKGSMTFSDRCGVCKDKAGMLVTMLRAAGFESYAAMTMAGSRIDYIPADQFNHSVTVVKLSDGKYHLLDPTWVPFVRELWSSAEQQQQYLMGLPEGADLATTPLSPPENHYYRLQGNSKLREDGTLEGEFTLEVEGQTDAAFRRLFMRSYRATWMASLQQQLLHTAPRMEIIKADFSDPVDYSHPLKIRVSYRIPDYALVSGEEILFTPLLASNLFGHRYLNDHLHKNTSLEERKYQFRTRCSKLIEISERIELPRFKKADLPRVEAVNGSGADFAGGYRLKGRTLHLAQKIVLKKRIYDPQDWPSYRAAVLAQKKLAEDAVILYR